MRLKLKFYSILFYDTDVVATENIFECLNWYKHSYST